MTSSLYVIRRPLQQVERSLLLPDSDSSPIIGIEGALSSSQNFAEVLYDASEAKQVSGPSLSPDDLLELAFNHSNVIVL